MFFNKKKLEARRDKYLFVIGFNKTGTTSIHRLFQKSGYRSVHWDEGRLAKTMLDNVMKSRPVMEGYHHEFDVFSDMVFRNKGFYFEGHSLFRQMFMDYPNGYFLYNTRDIDAWVISRANHPNLVDGDTELKLHERLLGTDNLDSILDFWKEKRLRFEADIQAFFKDKDNFIQLDITDDNFAQKLSNFTGFDLDPANWNQYNKTLTQNE